VGSGPRNFNPNYFKLELYIQKVYLASNLFIIRAYPIPSSGHSIELQAADTCSLQDQLF
jgi:hypothetical protein